MLSSLFSEVSQLKADIGFIEKGKRLSDMGIVESDGMESYKVQDRESQGNTEEDEQGGMNMAYFLISGRKEFDLEDFLGSSRRSTLVVFKALASP